MKKVFVLLSLLGIIVYGCGHHHKRGHRKNVATVSTASTANIPSNVVIAIQQPPAIDQQALIDAIRLQLLEFSRVEQVEVEVVIEITNEVEVDASVEVEGDTIVVRPGWQRHIPRLYHWLCKVHKKKCRRGHCGRLPKPCNNEEE